MGRSVVILTSIVVLVILVIISMFSGIWDFWGFFGILFYIFLYIGGYLFIKIGANNREIEQDTTLQRTKRFEHCWDRVNEILKSFPGGQGIEWARGVGRKSSIKSYYDGIQNKPFRSIIAHLDITQQLVMVIYDIEGDDIAEFITNPSPELIDNPFLNFKPYARGVNRDSGLDRFGGYNNQMRYPQQSRRRRGGGISINVDNNDMGFGDMDQENTKLYPQKNIVDNALSKLKK